MFGRKKKKDKKENLFIRVLNRLLKLNYLKLLELSIGFVKGFSVKIEFFEEKGKVNAGGVCKCPGKSK